MYKNVINFDIVEKFFKNFGLLLRVLVLRILLIFEINVEDSWRFNSLKVILYINIDIILYYIWYMYVNCIWKVWILFIVFLWE